MKDEHTPVLDPFFLTAVIFLEIVKLIIESNLVSTLKRQNSVVASDTEYELVRRSLPSYFHIWLIITTLLRLYFFASLGILTQVDSNMEDTIISAQGIFRYLSVSIFYASTIFFPNFMLQRINKQINFETAMLPISGAFLAMGLLIVAHIIQVFVPGGLDSSCECWVTTVSVTSFIAGILSTPLYIYDIVWAHEYYKEATPYFNVEGAFVHDKIELTTASQP
jgi:hypothetical protein